MKKNNAQPLNPMFDEIPAFDLAAAEAPNFEMTPVDFGGERDRVEAAALAGEPEDKIARMVGLDVETLRKRYADELAHTPKRALEKVAAALRKTADNPKPSRLRTKAREFLRTRRPGGKV